jgi:hypothetical protein
MFRVVAIRAVTCAADRDRRDRFASVSARRPDESRARGRALRRFRALRRGCAADRDPVIAWRSASARMPGGSRSARLRAARFCALRRVHARLIAIGDRVLPAPRLTIARARVREAGDDLGVAVARCRS